MYTTPNLPSVRAGATCEGAEQGERGDERYSERCGQADGRDVEKRPVCRWKSVSGEAGTPWAEVEATYSGRRRR